MNACRGTLRFLVRPVSLAVLKPKRITAEAIEKALKTAVEVLQRGDSGRPPLPTYQAAFSTWTISSIRLARTGPRRGHAGLLWSRRDENRP